MTELTPQQVNELCAGAEQYYNPELPYHNWSHAQEVMANVVAIPYRFMGGNRGRNPATYIRQDLLQIAAAHHDDEHDSAEAEHYPSKEHYAAFIAERDLEGVLEPGEIEAVKGMILATRFRAPRRTSEEVILHYADVWNMAADYPEFYDHSVRLWREHGSEDWDAFRQQSEWVIGVTVSESLSQNPRTLCGMMAPWGDPYYFPTRVRRNLEQFMQEPEPDA